MGLLWMDYEKEFQNLADTAFQLECDGNPEYFASLSQRVRKIVYRDTRYNIDYLYTSYLLNDDKIMSDYAAWLYKLMYSVLKHLNASETADYVIRHLGYIRQAVLQTVSSDKHPRLLALLDIADSSVRDAAGHADEQADTIIKPSRYEDEIHQYMNSLLEKNQRKSLHLIHQFTEKGIPLNDIYVEILAESMRRIGELWHTARITVDEEHYCTSVTQTAMAQFYPVLFSKERKNRMLLCACPGTELHEMGARMVADIFENDGWDSLYLGAAVPEDAMLDAIRNNHPDLVALSVTMPQHLLSCQDLVMAIRREFPDQKLAVGGKAFRSTDALWSKWPVDIYTEDARQLLSEANLALNAS